MSILTEFQGQRIAQDYFNASASQLTEKILAAKKQFGSRLLILAHHYQKDEIVDLADEVGDSLQLAQLAAKNKTAKYIVFCGVHFMAETADMLTEANQQVILPDLTAGCTMADMADRYQLQAAWEQLQEKYPAEILPITYTNSTAAVKAFVGEHGGVTVTSSNATQVLKWAFKQKKRIFFLPDQHLGRNTAFGMGIPLSDMALWNPRKNELIASAETDPRVILWDGWCSVHQQFTSGQIKALKQADPEINIIVHPECPQEVVALADEYGSTNKILQVVSAAPAGSHWAIGTDNNLVGRMKDTFTDKKISFLNPRSCACLTMNRIRLPHLAWSLEQLVQGEVVNQITVDERTTKSALKALERMLALS